MKRTFYVLMASLVAACETPTIRNTTATAIQQEMQTWTQPDATPARVEDVSTALLPPISVPMPRSAAVQSEPRFDLVVNNTPVSQVFAAIASGTRYSILVPPSADGNVTLNLKNVTVVDALEAIREMYGYEYQINGSRIFIQPMTLQTRIFQVNYLTGQRKGESQLRVSSSSISDNHNGTSGSSQTSGMQSGSSNASSSKVSMATDTDFWGELTRALSAIVGNEKDRSVTVSPMSGMVVVRAMPDEIRNVEAYLRATQISIERQVILEAKIIEVQLSEDFQSGVNWAGFKVGPNSRISGGMVSPGTTLSPLGMLANGIISSTPGSNLAMSATQALPADAVSGGLFGLAFQTSNFSALMNFLESQGNVHVLSSPRIATLNNQKAVLKVGKDEFFVTEVTGGTQATANVAGTSPTVKVQPFFSGIALDVTPRIDENNDIILHVHPSVSQVSTVTTVVDLGSSSGVNNRYSLPLASSSISETDSIVRARDGQIVAIGGLMRQATADDRSGLPGMPKPLFGQVSKATEKRELVILLKPTVVDSNRSWADDITRSRDRVNQLIAPAVQ